MTHATSIPVQQPTHSRQCDLGVLGHFAASTIEDWHVVGLEVLLPDSHWPGYERSKDSTPCRIVGFIDPFPWPPSESQSNAAAYVVETEGDEYAFQPLQIEAVLPPPVLHRIGLQPPPPPKPKNCEWDPYRRGYFDKTTGAPHVHGTRSVASRDLIRANDTAAHSARRSDTYDLESSDSSWLIPHDGDIDKWRWLPERSFAFPPPGGRNFAKLERTWRLVHMDLRVGPR